MEVGVVERGGCSELAIVEVRYGLDVCTAIGVGPHDDAKAIVHKLALIEMYDSA